jgi:hypothetical protein
MGSALRRTLALAAGLALFSCSPPPRPSTDGYVATVTIVSDGAVETTFRIAVRGSDRRREGEKPGGPVLLLLGKELKAFRLDPAAKTYVPVPYPQATDEMLPGFPLSPGFDDRAEAAQRGVTEYRRESDEVSAGMVCALWRFIDQPEAVVSSSTVYWVAPSLENLAIRMDREVPKPDGTRSRRTVQLTSVKVGADPELFEVPKGYRPAAPPR